MKLERCYHWSPSKNRKSIAKEGLTVFNSAIEFENPITGKEETWDCPYICSSLDPLTAYKYVVPMFSGEVELPSLDLWCFDLIDTDDVVVRSDRTREVIEVRVLNSISADRVHFVATREKEY